MKATKTTRILAVILLVLSLILTIGVATVFKPCDAKEDGSWMNCHYAGRNVMFVGIALCALSLLHFPRKSNRLILDAIQLVLSILALLIPGTIMHLCMMDAMRCNAVMKPSVTILAVLIAAVSVVDAIFYLRKSKAE